MSNTVLEGLVLIMQRPSRELLRLVSSFALVTLVMYLESVSVFIVQYHRFMDANRYPPLPDILLDKIHFLPWAFYVTECIMLFFGGTLITICAFHKHR